MSDQNNRLSFQYLGTIIALVISCLALLVSVYEATILQSQQKAMVWPYVKVSDSYSNEGFSVYATNNGVGPALIQSLEVRYDGEPVANYDDLLDAMQPGRTFGYDVVYMTSLNGTVLKAGEKRLLFRFPIEERTRGALDNVGKVDLTLQFDSVLGQSWVFSKADDTVQEGVFKASLEFRE